MKKKENKRGRSKTYTRDYLMKEIEEAMVEKGEWLSAQEVDDSDHLPCEATIRRGLGNGWRWNYFADFHPRIGEILDILDMKNSGMTFREISEEIDIAPSNIHHLIKKWMVIKGLWEERSWKK